MTAADIAARGFAVALANAGREVALRPPGGALVPLRAMVSYRHDGDETPGARVQGVRIIALAADVLALGLPVERAIGGVWTVEIDGAEREIRSPVLYADRSRATVALDLYLPA